MTRFKAPNFHICITENGNPIISIFSHSRHFVQSYTGSSHYRGSEFGINTYQEQIFNIGMFFSSLKAPRKRLSVKNINCVKIGSPFSVMQMRSFLVLNFWTALLSSNTVVYECVCQILHPCDVYVCCKSVKNVTYVKKIKLVGLPFSVMQMRKFAAFKLRATLISSRPFP